MERMEITVAWIYQADVLLLDNCLMTRRTQLTPATSTIRIPPKAEDTWNARMEKKMHVEASMSRWKQENL